MAHSERDHVLTRQMLIPCLEIRIGEDAHDARNVQHGCRSERIVKEPLDEVLKESQ